MQGSTLEHGMQKCGYCKKILSTACFELNPVTGCTYSKCSKCRPKHAKSCHKKRDRESKSRQEAASSLKLQRVLSGDWHKCANCELIPRSRFSFKADGTLKVLCDECMQKRSDYAKSDAGKAADSRYHKSERGSLKRKEWLSTDAGKDSTKRSRGARKERYNTDHALALSVGLHNVANQLISGKYKTSRKFIQHTSFESEYEFLEHMKTRVLEAGLDWSIRSSFQVEHLIPICAYDHSNELDVKKCWSKANIAASSPLNNKRKSYKLDIDSIRKVGPVYFPLSWHGNEPSEDVMKAHVSTVLGV